MDEFIEALNGFEADVRRLRGRLQKTETALRRLRQTLARGRTLAEALTEAPPSGLREMVGAGLDAFEASRRKLRLTAFRVLRDEGFGVTEIARLYGVSHQLVSRMMRGLPVGQAGSRRGR